MLQKAPVDITPDELIRKLLGPCFAATPGICTLMLMNITKVGEIFD